MNSGSNKRRGPDKPAFKRVIKKPSGKRPESPAKAVKVGAEQTGDRIAKVMARAGLCSRRDAERWIESGRVVINGKVLERAAYNVQRGDVVLVDGKPLPGVEPARVWRYHKPAGLMTTHNDPEGRPTIFERMPGTMPRVISVGRLDLNTEGLLLLTNDGALARYLELPKTGWMRRYRVRIFGKLTQAGIDALAKGITVEGINYGQIDARIDRDQGRNQWLSLALREGRNREIKRVMQHLDLHVNRLIRVSYGPFVLGNLEAGNIEEVKAHVLRDQLGAKQASDAGIILPESATQHKRGNR